MNLVSDEVDLLVDAIYARGKIMCSHINVFCVQGVPFNGGKKPRGKKSP
jgi:hypothetical protein